MGTLRIAAAIAAASVLGVTLGACGDSATTPAGSDVRLDMPIIPPNAAREGYGLWPYAVHGGGHPEGHPGWDVEYTEGAKVRAMADGVVRSVEAVPEHNSFRISIEHGSGISTSIDALGPPEPGIVDGGQVSRGDAIASPHPTFGMAHIGVIANHTEVCPEDWLSEAGQMVFEEIFRTAGYGEELTEPFACNEMGTSFPHTRVWTRTAGALEVNGSSVQTIEFTRLDAETHEYTYALLDGGGNEIESGEVANFVPLHLSEFGKIVLDPEGVDDDRVGVINIIGGEMQIDLGPPPPTNLADAATFTTN
jgi:hypothetical protein